MDTLSLSLVVLSHGKNQNPSLEVAPVVNIGQCIGCIYVCEEGRTNQRLCARLVLPSGDPNVISQRVSIADKNISLTGP